MKIDGSCHCGAITYEAIVDPRRVSICHCTDCQTLTGSAFRVTVPAPQSRFTILTGEPKLYVKTAESGNKRIQAFCPDCGTPLYATSAGEGPKIYGIRTGTVRQRRELAPRHQIWRRSALDWVSDVDSIPAIDTEK